MVYLDNCIHNQINKVKTHHGAMVRQLLGFLRKEEAYQAKCFTTMFGSVATN
jgi:hypothetical protein